MFVDQAIISVRGGNGGRGCVSFRKESYVPMGGPDGGNGGNGGNIMIIADENTDTLSDYLSKKKFEAPKGGFGSGKNKTGKGGEDMFLRVPPGTAIYDADSDELLADLAVKGDQVLIARGGRGGYGNAHFKSATRQAPDFAELGEPGEQKNVRLELKLVADVGFIGYPSVGKSSLIAAVSSAKPKIADYPFTTLIPNLGVAQVFDREFVVCDVPGLIEGASEGKGLGDQFLRHIERCGILVHILDVSREDAVADYRAIRKELAAYSPALAGKRELVVLNKIDLVADDPVLWIDQLKDDGIDVFASISAASRHGIEDFLKKLLPIVLEERERRDTEIDVRLAEPEMIVLRPNYAPQRMGAYRINRTDDTTVKVVGQRLEQFTAMSDFSKEGGRQRFYDVAERIGLVRALKREGMNEDTKIFIGNTDVTAFIK